VSLSILLTEQKKIMFVQLRALLFASLCLDLVAAPSAVAGDISGLITITRRLTPRPVAASFYESRGISVAAPAESTVTTAEEYARVVVYLDGPELPPGPPASAEITQKGRHFEPAIVHVPVGSTVSFPNGDPIFHNVFSLSKAKQFDLGYYPEGRTRVVRFERPGVVQVYCHLHSNMSAAVLVVPSAWHTQPGGDGSFSLTGIPAGRNEIVAWHRTAGAFKRWIDVPAAGSTEVAITIPLRDGDQASQ
jgi:plastocyanin